MPDDVIASEFLVALNASGNDAVVQLTKLHYFFLGC
jgi:hypothetical protein